MMTLGLSPALGSSLVSAPAGPNPNRLLWSEDLTQAAWVKTNFSINPDASGTLDEVSATAPSGALRQVTTTAASTGSAATAAITMTGTAARGSVSGTFDGLAYTFSVKLEDLGIAGNPQLRLRLDISGGFLRCSIEDAFSGDADFLAGEFQLEQAAAFTTYHFRGGT